jgi:hypothetical protein
MIKAIFGQIFNGQKLNTGLVMVAAVFVLQQLGLDHSAAVQTASAIMAGIGGVWALIGLIHKYIKGIKTAK